MRLAAPVAVLLLALAAAAQAQVANGPDPLLVGQWTSTMVATNQDASPPVKYTETVNLTVGANGNIYLERFRRPLNAKTSDSFYASGVYRILAPGLIGLTFSQGFDGPDAWNYKVVRDTLTIMDSNNVIRKFSRLKIVGS